MKNINMSIHSVKTITIKPPTVKESTWSESGEHRWQCIVIGCESGEDIEITVHSDNPIEVIENG
jgi:hypothetical protein